MSISYLMLCSLSSSHRDEGESWCEPFSTENPTGRWETAATKNKRATNLAAVHSGLVDAATLRAKVQFLKASVFVRLKQRENRQSQSRVSVVTTDI